MFFGGHLEPNMFSTFFEDSQICMGLEDLRCFGDDPLSVSTLLSRTSAADPVGFLSIEAGDLPWLS